MENNELIVEQPNLEELQPLTDVENEIGQSDSIIDGSTKIGKFENSQTLLEAYNNLQAEFTKKCQKLSELEKQSLNNFESTKEYDKKQILPAETDSNKDKDWSDVMSDFISSHPEAKNFSKDILKEIINDKNLLPNESTVEKVYLSIMEKKFKSPESLTDDADFMEKFIYGNRDVKNKIISDYINLLDDTLPPLISKGAGGISLTPKNKASSISEAGNIALNLFGVNN